MGRKGEMAQPARPGQSTATSLPPVQPPRDSHRTQPPPLSWSSGPQRRQVAACLPRRGTNTTYPALPPRYPRPQPRARPPAPEPAVRFSLALTPEAALLIQKRRRRQQQLPGAPDLGSLLKISLLNEQHRYDGEEYEEEEREAPDRGVLQKCEEWLRGVENATRAGDRLRALPHLWQPLSREPSPPPPCSLHHCSGTSSHTRLGADLGTS